MTDTPPNEPDATLAWYMVLGPWCSYDQDALLRPRLAAIRRLYPTSRIMVHPSESDPATVARWRAATADLGIDWLSPRPIHGPGSGVTSIGAMPEAYLDDPQPAEFLIKADLDARVWRRFRDLPHGRMGVFGTLEFVADSGYSYGDFPNVQGGCYGLGRETGRRIAEGDLLNGPELRENPGIWLDRIEDWRALQSRRGKRGEKGDITNKPEDSYPPARTGRRGEPGLFVMSPFLPILVMSRMALRRISSSGLWR